MCKETGALAQPLVVRRHGGQVGALHRRHEPAVRGQAQDDVREREGGARDIGLRCLQLAFKHLHVPIPVADTARGFRAIAMRGAGAGAAIRWPKPAPPGRRSCGAMASVRSR
jgi:hypothetical protein